MRPQNQFGMSDDPADEDRLVMTPEKKKMQDAVVGDEAPSSFDDAADDDVPDDDASDDLDDDDEDGGIDVSDLGDDVIPDDADDPEQEEPMDNEPTIQDTCEHCGAGNRVLPPRGYSFAKTGETNAARVQRLKGKPDPIAKKMAALDEAFVAAERRPCEIFREAYHRETRPRQAFPW